MNSSSVSALALTLDVAMPCHSSCRVGGSFSLALAILGLDPTSPYPCRPRKVMAPAVAGSVCLPICKQSLPVCFFSWPSEENSRFCCNFASTLDTCQFSFSTSVVIRTSLLLYQDYIIIILVLFIYASLDYIPPIDDMVLPYFCVPHETKH